MPFEKLECLRVHTEGGVAVVLATPSSQERMSRFLEVGGQTRDGELNLAALIEMMADGDRG